MKAIIMAGGEGKRLRPLTCVCPKPMLRLMGRPLMEYALRLLKKHGIETIGATLGYLAEEVRAYFGDGSEFGVDLRYYVEETPLGTAGSVRQAAAFLDERFIVLSGDGVNDFDLGAAVAFHEASGAKATLILKQCADPQEYGMVVCAPDGRIRAFHEKPGRCEVYSDRVNTGVYILEPELLERIPEGVASDFGRDLFPALVREGVPIYGWTDPGYWCDVGDVGAYLRVHADAMDGRIRLEGLERCGVRAEGARIDPGSVLEPPCFIAPGAHICGGARVGAYSAVGEGARVEPGASLKRSVVLSGAHVGRNAQLRGCVVAEGAQLGEAAQLFEESVVGALARVGAHATLPPGVKLWPEKGLPEGERPQENIVWGAKREQRFVSGALQLDSPAQAARDAQACVAELRPTELLLGRGASGVADALWHAVAAGAMSQGVQIIDAGECALPQLRHAQSILRADAAMLIEDGALLPLDERGARLSERAQRAILKLCERQDYAGAFSGVTRPLQSAGRTDIAYIAEAADRFAADPRLAPGIALCAPNPLLGALAEQAFLRAGLRVRREWDAAALRPEADELGVLLDADGERFYLSDAQGRMDELQRQLMCAYLALEAGETRLILPLSATRAIDALAEARGAQAVYLAGESAAWMRTLAETAPRQFIPNFDGIAAALCALSALTDRGLTLAQWREQMPIAYRSARGVPVPPAQSGRLLRRLAADSPEAELGGGVRLKRPRGWVWLSPDDARPELSVMAESRDMEAADELCRFYAGEIERLLSAPED